MALQSPAEGVRVRDCPAPIQFGKAVFSCLAPPHARTVEVKGRGFQWWAGCSGGGGCPGGTPHAGELALYTSVRGGEFGSWPPHCMAAYAVGLAPCKRPVTQRCARGARLRFSIPEPQPELTRSLCRPLHFRTFLAAGLVLVGSNSTCPGDGPTPPYSSLPRVSGVPLNSLFLPARGFRRAIPFQPAPRTHRGSFLETRSTHLPGMVLAFRVQWRRLWTVGGDDAFALRRAAVYDVEWGAACPRCGGAWASSDDVFEGGVLIGVWAAVSATCGSSRVRNTPHCVLTVQHRRTRVARDVTTVGAISHYSSW